MLGLRKDVLLSAQCFTGSVFSKWSFLTNIDDFFPKILDISSELN